MENAFSRRQPSRHFKRLFVIATEGGRTEPAYFKRLQQLVGYQTVKIEVSADLNHSAPNAVLARIQQAERGALKEGDELWCAIDRDDWPKASIDALAHWAQQAKAGVARGLALSSPKFELWLLAHFEAMAGNPHVSQKALVTSIKTHIPDYRKGSLRLQLSEAMILQAISRCREAYGDDLPAYDGVGTTVHLLVESILDAARTGFGEHSL